MNTKKSLIIFGFYVIWLALFGLSFTKASVTVGPNLQNGLIWFGVSLLIGIAGVFISIRLNRKQL